MKVAGAIRVSTDDQALSVDAQRTRIVEYCAFNKYTLVDIFIDENVSGSIPICERPNGGKLCNLINTNEIQAVVAVKLDRLFRSASDALIMCDNWMKHGVSMHLIDMGGMSMNTDTAMGKMMLTIFAGIAEMERNMTSERVKFVLNDKKNKSLVYGPIPYGFNEDAGKLIVDESKMEVVKTIFEWRSFKSFQTIADNLNSQCIAGPKGGEWVKSSIFNIINNSIYINHLKLAA